MPLTPEANRDRRAGARRRVRARTVVAAALAALLLAPASGASAAQVLALHHGRVAVERDRWVGVAPAIERAAPAPVLAHASAAAIPTVLERLVSSRRISRASADADQAILEDAVSARDRLGGTPRSELTAAIDTIASLAARGQLSAPRLPLLFTQLRRNTIWWGETGRVPFAGQRVHFGSSQVLYQYVPGQGLQFHPLANWGRAEAQLHDGYWKEGLEMVDELVPMASTRGTALTWEYFFWFGGGRPPWTSGLSQGTALISLSMAAAHTHDRRYADAARQALELFDLPAPLGVRVRTRLGSYYAEYSFAPGYRIINGFVQALNGLWDVWHRLGDAHAGALFAAGDRDARRSLPYYDLGHWSRYSNRGEISDVNYHVLLRDFLRGLCQRTRIEAYCAKAARFTYYLRRYGGPGRLPPGTHIV